MRCQPIGKKVWQYDSQGSLSYTLLPGAYIDITTVENNLELPPKVYHNFWASNYTSGILLLYIPKTFAHVQQEVSTRMFRAVLLTLAKIWQPKCLSVEELVNKLWYIYMIKYYTAGKTHELT